MLSSLKYDADIDVQNTIGANIISVTRLADVRTSEDTSLMAAWACAGSAVSSGGAMISVGVRIAVGIGCPMLLSFSMLLPSVAGTTERFLRIDVPELWCGAE